MDNAQECRQIDAESKVLFPEESLETKIEKRAKNIMTDDMDDVMERLKGIDLYDDFMVDLGCLGIQKDWTDKAHDVRIAIQAIARKLAREQLEDEGVY